MKCPDCDEGYQISSNGESHRCHGGLTPKIATYLDNLHASSWGRGFDISRPDSRKQAIDFIADLIKKVTER